VTTRSHDTEAVRKCIAACEPTEVIRVGGAGHKVVMLHSVIFIKFCLTSVSLNLILNCVYFVAADRCYFSDAETEM